MAARFTISFKNLAGDNCVFTISDTDFVGTASALEGSSSQPVVITHEANEENVFEPIMATSCDVRYLNDGTTPLSLFETANATRFTGSLTVGGVTKFVGILSLDDLSERVEFATHECRLTFTDGLGLLRNYTIGDIDLTPLKGRYRNVQIIQSILRKTGIELPLYTFLNVYEQQMDDRGTSNTADPLYQSALNIRSFTQNSSDEDKWENCYEALRRIIDGFQAQIFQEGGVWNIVRVVEMVNNPAGTHYAINGTVVGPVANVFTAKTDMDAIERSQVKVLKRAARKVTRTFEYRYPQLLPNANLGRVGNLRGTIVDGLNTIYRYDVVDIALNQGQDAEIRVVRNTTSQRELDRYLYLYFNTNLRAAAVFGPVEADVDDGFILTFRYKAESDSNFSGEFRAGLFLDAYDSTKWIAVGNLQLSIMYWVQDPTMLATNWQSLGQIYLRGSDDLTSFRNVQITVEDIQGEALTFPADGQLYIGIYGWNNNANRRADKDAIVENIRFEYIKYVNGGLNVRGHEHIISQTTNYNREEQEDLYVDDTPATSIKGTLFFVGGGSAPIRTESWSDDGVNFFRLGELNAKRRMSIDGVTRINLQGGFKNAPTLYNYAEFSFLSGRKFVRTRFAYDVRRDTVEGTFAEVAGPNSTGTTSYEYKILYE